MNFYKGIRKSGLILGLILGLQNLASAQELKFEFNTVDGWGYITEFELIAKNKLVNTTIHTEMVWIREDNTLPAAWTAAICDNALCHNIDIDSADFTMMQNDSFDFKVNFYPQTNNGRATNRVRVYAKNDPSVSTTAVFNAQGWGLSVYQTDAQGLLIYPNPANEVLVVELPRSNAGDIQVLNALGQEVIRGFVSGNKAELNTTSLAEGVYVLNIRQGDHTYTRKFLKN